VIQPPPTPARGRIVCHPQAQTEIGREKEGKGRRDEMIDRRVGGTGPRQYPVVIERR